MARFAIGAKLVVLFTLLTAVMTWPQAASIATAAQEHQDVYFNMWRFGWVAHALATSPPRLFDGNIFHPEPRTLTFSDAMPVEAFLAAPLLWAGTPPVLVHNVMLLAGIVLSAAGIAVLARSLTGSLTAGVIAGVVFAFAPYRFEHYMHMELQWTVWMPWAFWGLHRTLDPVSKPKVASGFSRTSRVLKPLLETGAWKYGTLTGLFVALQFMSSIYYGIFLATLACLAAVLLLCGMRGRPLKRALAALAAGAVLAAVLVAPYALPYLATKKDLGARSEEQVLTYSAQPSNYTIATDENYLYGERSAPRGRPERRLFPGIAAVLLAVVGLLLRPPSREAIVYLLALVAAFEMSLGRLWLQLPLSVPARSRFRRPARARAPRHLRRVLPRRARGLGTRGRRGRAAAAASTRACGADLWSAAARVLGGAASADAVPQRAAAVVCLARTTAARRGRRVPDAGA